MGRYPNTFSPLELGNLALPNRIVMAPMGTGYADEAHHITPQLVAYHVARARGKVGLNIVEHTAVEPEGLTGPRMLGVFRDDMIDGLSLLTDEVHNAEGRIALQLQHGGPQADPAVNGGELLGPSAMAWGREGRTLKELHPREIKRIVQGFADAAFRAKKAGFDGVEVHMAHGYLGCAFLSPLTNQRTDAYGGDTARRTRFAAEVAQAISRRCGPDFPMWCRVSADELVPEGINLEEMVRIAPLLAQCGYCAIHVSAGTGATAHWASAPYTVPEGHLLDLARAVKDAVTIPVIGVGNLRSPASVETAISKGRCDAVALGRALLADPDWCQKAQSGQDEDIIPCIQCNLGCSDRRRNGEGLLECVTNPCTGHESEWADWPDGPGAEKPKNILIVGGGPAGMTAAAVAARRGHKVILWEKRATLGGRLDVMACYERGTVFRQWITRLTGALDDAGVEVGWQTAGEAGTVVGAGADAVVLATGARYLKPEEVLAEGCEARTLNAADYLMDPDVELFNLVAVLGGGELGCQAALRLARSGHMVMLFERRPELAMDMVGSVRQFLLKDLADAQVQAITHAEVVSVSADERVTIVVKGSERETFPPASVIVALGRASEQELAPLKQNLDVPVHIIGDAAEPRTIHHAVWEGAQVGRLL